MKQAVLYISLLLFIPSQLLSQPKMVTIPTPQQLQAQTLNKSRLFSFVINNDQAGIASLVNSKKVSINDYDQQGFTPLIYAINNNNTKMVTFLVQTMKADTNKVSLFAYKDSKGALHTSTEPMYKKLVYYKNVGTRWVPVPQSKVQKECGPNDTCGAYDGTGLDTPLIIAISQKNPSLDIVNTLLANGADPNLADMQGNTALNIAVMKSSNPAMHDIIQSLLNNKADPYQKNNAGASASDFARLHHLTDILQMISDTLTNQLATL